MGRGQMGTSAGSHPRDRRAFPAKRTGRQGASNPYALPWYEFLSPKTHGRDLTSTAWTRDGMRKDMRA
eukprot:7555313-Pyramimonas_sp.AAC.1